MIVGIIGGGASGMAAALRAAGAGAAHLSPAHQYPTGLVTPIRRRPELLRWADYEIRNDGTIEQLKARTLQVLAALRGDQ